MVLGKLLVRELDRDLEKPCVVRIVAVCVVMVALGFYLMIAGVVLRPMPSRLTQHVEPLLCREASDDASDLLL